MDASDSHYIRNVKAFRDFIAVEERIDGLDHVRLIDRSGESRYVTFPESAYTAGIDNNPEFATDTLRIEYSSMVTPSTVFDYHVDSQELEVRKVQQIPSGYDASQYVTERVSITARDGVQVPASIVRRRDTPVDGAAPLYLYGYGAYGLSMPPGFSTTRLSLLDRGFIFAIAHIRGGDDLGYHWYEAGKLDRRTNTFNDFVDVARGLIAQGYGSAGRIAIAGGSAGGQLMGAAVNQAPELWGAVAAHVPFVDALNTMLDDTLPLTPIEWPEWGNPIKDPDGLRVHPLLLPLRPAGAARISPDAGYRRAERPQSHLLGASQVRSQDADAEDRRQPAAAQDQHGRGPRRQVRPLRPAIRGSRGVRLHAGIHGAGRIAGPWLPGRLPGGRAGGTNTIAGRDWRN